MKIRCCVIDKKKYRGIDREVSLRLFNRIADKETYQGALDRYLQYVSLEEVYTPENVALVQAFAEHINRHYGACEVIVYDPCPIDETALWNCLGIDVVDAHLKSILNCGKFQKSSGEELNQNGLCADKETAERVIEQQKNTKSGDLQSIYVYGVE